MIIVGLFQRAGRPTRSIEVFGINKRTIPPRQLRDQLVPEAIIASSCRFKSFHPAETRIDLDRNLDCACYVAQRGRFRPVGDCTGSHNGGLREAWPHSHFMMVSYGLACHMAFHSLRPRSGNHSRMQRLIQLRLRAVNPAAEKTISFR